MSFLYTKSANEYVCDEPYPQYCYQPLEDKPQKKFSLEFAHRYLFQFFSLLNVVYIKFSHITGFAHLLSSKNVRNIKKQVRRTSRRVKRRVLKMVYGESKRDQRRRSKNEASKSFISEKLLADDSDSSSSSDVSTDCGYKSLV